MLDAAELSLLPEERLVEFTVNGTTYAAWDDVPEDLRDALRRTMPDTNKDGIPDLFEGRPASQGHHVLRSATFTVEGKEYASADDLPADVRAALEGTGALPTPAGATSARAPSTPARPANEYGGIVLDGAPVSASGEPYKKRWWRRG